MNGHLENKSSELTAFLRISSQIGRREAKHRLAMGWRGRAEAGVEGKGRGRGGGEGQRPVGGIHEGKDGEGKDAEEGGRRVN